MNPPLVQQRKVTLLTDFLENLTNKVNTQAQSASPFAKSPYTFTIRNKYM